MTAPSPPATPDRDKKEISLEIMRTPDEDRKIENSIPGGLNVLLPGKLSREAAEVAAAGSRRRKLGQKKKVEVAAASNRKFNNMPVKTRVNYRKKKK